MTISGQYLNSQLCRNLAYTVCQEDVLSQMPDKSELGQYIGNPKYSCVFLSVTARRCESLKPIFNGKYEINPYNTFSAHARYTCNEGYILSGQPERVCQGDGYWSSEPPTCETEGKIHHITNHYY